MSTMYSSDAVAKEILKDIKDEKFSSDIVIYGMLNQIVNDLPGTEVAKEAQKLLDELFN